MANVLEVVFAIGIFVVMFAYYLIIAASLSIGGLFIALVNYFQAIYGNVSLESLEDINIESEYQPARKSYFFKKWYVDLKNTIHTAWLLNLESADKELSMDLSFVYKISVIVFGTIWLIPTSIIHIVLMLVIEFLYFILFSFIRIIEFIYLWITNIFISCPYCYNKYELPHYFCPNCNTKHTKLIPDQYGILFRTCICGNNIPTSFFSGRNKLKKCCPHCNNEISNEFINKTNIGFSIVGLQNSEKSHFLFALVYLLEKENNIHLTEVGTKIFDLMKRQIVSNRKLNKTIEIKPTSMTLNETENKIPCILNFFDHAGELYDDIDDIKSLPYYFYTKGYFFILNSLELKNEIEKNIKILERLIQVLRQTKNIKSNELIDIPVAIVFNRMDIEEVSGYVDIFVKEEDFVKFNAMLENNFLHFKIFKSSSLGNSLEGKIEPYGVKEAFFWIRGIDS